ncbi:MAG: hypothetical protein AB7O38_31300 [Pirellulaceae bacterium]
MTACDDAPSARTRCFSRRAATNAGDWGVLYPDAAVVYIREATLWTILNYSSEDTQSERGSLLFGRVRETTPPSVHIGGYVPAHDTTAGAARLTFHHATWTQAQREAAVRFPDLQLVGWHHTHPGLGVFLSGYDRFVHQHFFSSPWQVALVVDPVRQEFGFFQWRHGTIVDCGFRCGEAS